MALMKIRDNAVWAKHIVDGPEIVERIRSLRPQQPIVLVIDNKPIRFVKMQDGTDGRSTNGVKPDPVFKSFWDTMQERRGETVTVTLEPSVDDAYLASISTLLSEWDSPEDAAAYDHL